VQTGDPEPGEEPDPGFTDAALEDPDWIAPVRAELAAGHDDDNGQGAGVTEMSDDAFKTLTGGVSAKEWRPEQAAAMAVAPERADDNAPPEDAEHRESIEARLRAHLIDGNAILDVPPPLPLIGPGPNDVPVLDLDSLAVLYGPAGVGKTFLALSLALSIARGAWWYDHPVSDAGRVLYVIAEAAGSLAPRVDAWLKHRDQNQVGTVTWLPVPVNLMDRASVAAFEAIATELDACLIVFDTLARCMRGADENSARDVGIVVDHLDRIRRTTGACILGVHHTGKDESAGARGSSALKGGVETELELVGDRDHLVLTAKKQRNAIDGVIGHYRLAPVADSVVLAPASTSTDGQLRASTFQVLEVLAEVDDGDGMGSGALKAACAPLAVRSYYRALKELAEDALAAKSGKGNQTRYALTDKGRDLVAANCQ
jgi:hypothetical protein